MKPCSVAAVLCAVSWLAAIPAAYAAIVYDSTGIETGTFIDLIAEGYPDSGVQITLDGQERIVTSLDLMIGAKIPRWQSRGKDDPGLG